LLIISHQAENYLNHVKVMVLFIILYYFSKKPRPSLSVSGLFLLGYGAFRFIVEYWREPDDHLRAMAEYISMGQLLSLPMVFAGIAMIVWGYKYSPVKQQTK